MPQSYPTQDPFDTLYQQLDVLSGRIKELEVNSIPTVPVYDWSNPPQDAVEGQVARFINAPDASPIPGSSLDPGANGFWKTVAGVLTRATTVAWTELTGIPSAFPFKVRKNSTGSTFTRGRLNLIEGTNVTITVADDSADDEVDVTIASTVTGGTVTGGEILISDTPAGTPLVFADLIENEAQDDLVYADA